MASLAVPVAAQDTPAADDQLVPSPTPQDDLDCALFVSYVLGNLEDQSDAQQLAGLSAGVAYFVGRWESATKGDVTQAMADRYRDLKLNDFMRLGRPCGERMEVFGQKLQAASAAVGQVDAERQ